MLAKSHLSLGLIGGILVYPVSKIFGIERGEYVALILPLILLGSIFPDIDEPRSLIGRRFPLISRIVSLSFSHRGFTHFLVFPLIFLIAGILVNNHSISPYLFAFGYGILLHQIGDMLTISGIPYYFFPLSSKKAVLLPQALRFKTGSIVENTILVGILVPLIAILSIQFGLIGVDTKNVFKAIKEVERLIGGAL